MSKSQNDKNNQSEVSMDDIFSEKDILVQDLRRGSVLKGRIVSVGRNEALVDLGAKWEGILPLSEVGRETELEPGKEVPVYVITPQDRRGQVLLSAKRAQTVNAWQKLRESHEEGVVLEVKLTGFNKGGGLVDMWGLQGFLPFSQFVSRPSSELSSSEFQSALDRMKGSQLKVRVIDLSPDEEKIIVSEKEALREERAEKQREVFEELEEGEVVEGVVKEILPYGLLVEYSGVEALIPKGELSWKREKDSLSNFEIGQKVEAEIIGLPEDLGGRAKLSIKRLQKDPWQELLGAFEDEVGVSGRVAKIASFGVVIELSQGLEGLIPLSEIPEDKEVHVGDEVDLILKEVNPEEERLELSLGK